MHPSPLHQHPRRTSSCRPALLGALLSVCFGLAQAGPAPGLQAQSVARGLENPWAVAFVDEQRFLVTERPGRLRVVHADGRIEPPVSGLPAIDASGQGGLLDLVTDPDFARNRQLYFCYTEPGDGGTNGTALASARLSEDLRSLQQFKVLFRQSPKMAGRHHFGCRIVIDGQGYLLMTLGERFMGMQQAQTLDNHLGKIVRLHRDGRVPADNPFAGRSGTRPEIWSYGHRNPQGAALGPEGALWVHEHGPQGGDEVNRITPGRNYGWPVITFGEQYGGGRIGQGLTRQEGMEQPLHQWTPSIAPSGMAFIQGDRYGAEWRGQMVVGSLKFRRLHRLAWQGERLVREEQVETAGLTQRVRDVRQGPDGWLYIVTDATDGQLMRLLPQR
jgi:aldose sugar dehydrogenase